MVQIRIALITISHRLIFLSGSMQIPIQTKFQLYIPLLSNMSLVRTIPAVFSYSCLKNGRDLLLRAFFIHIYLCLDLPDKASVLLTITYSSSGDRVQKIYANEQIKQILTPLSLLAATKSMPRKHITRCLTRIISVTEKPFFSSVRLNLGNPLILFCLS